MRHPYHLLDISPWPLLIVLNIYSFIISMVSYLNGHVYSLELLFYSLICLLLIFSFWLYDIMIESSYLGYATFQVSRGLILGFIFFVLTEIMLFFSLFWAYFHSALNPTYLIWPPVGIDLINPWSIPLLNTFLLFYSGISATWAHHSSIIKNSVKARNDTIKGLLIAIFLGVIFFILQMFEYYNSTYDITDSVYSSAFFITTGAHGLHVVIGVLMLFFTFIRFYLFHISTLLFDISLIYYHFVDVVWIALFILIYYMSY